MTPACHAGDRRFKSGWFRHFKENMETLILLFAMTLSFTSFGGVGDVPEFNYKHDNHTLRYRVNCKKCHRGPTSGFKISQGLCHQCHNKDTKKSGYGVKILDCKSCHKNGAPKKK